MIEVFPILGEAAASTEPADGPFHDPSLWQDDEPFGTIGSFDDFDLRAGQNLSQAVTKDRSRITAVSKNCFQKGKLAEQIGHHHEAPVAVLDVGWSNYGVQQQSQRIDKDMALLALDQFTSIKPGWVNLAPPFSAAFTL